jgi:hypothetical protein
MKNAILILLIMNLLPTVAIEYHVDVKIGSDSNIGTKKLPFKSIRAAVAVAYPCDTITVHEGVYRERINPLRGGNSDKDRILYRAADYEEVHIKGSEIITNWVNVENSLWKVVIDNKFFGNYNPYKEIIYGDWFIDEGRIHHTGEVYINGKSLFEVENYEKVKNPVAFEKSCNKEASLYTWYCESNDSSTTIYANFKELDPTKNLVEINVRETCFYPKETGKNFITVRGFRMSQAATQWAPPTAEQIGLIGTNWSKGWIIENNIISDSKCSGITLGKDRKSGQNEWTKKPDKPGDVHQNDVIKKLLEYSGWNKENIGSHLVRKNTIFNCEQAGICGAYGGIFSIVQDNDIYDIWVKRQFWGHEIAGIKMHAPIDVLIEGNRLFNTRIGIWLDWETQGTRISGNLCYNNFETDLLIEMNHGPFVVDNNVLLSKVSLMNWSQGGAYINNLFAGLLELHKIYTRTAPYHKAHSTSIEGIKWISGGDDKYYNNFFIGMTAEEQNNINVSKKRKGRCGLVEYNHSELPIFSSGNIYTNGAKPSSSDENFYISNNDTFFYIENRDNQVYLNVNFDNEILDNKRKYIKGYQLKKTLTSNLPYENWDETPLVIDRDYFNKKRAAKSVTGPFNITICDTTLKIWPKK